MRITRILANGDKILLARICSKYTPVCFNDYLESLYFWSRRSLIKVALHWRGSIKTVCFSQFKVFAGKGIGGPLGTENPAHLEWAKKIADAYSANNKFAL